MINSFKNKVWGLMHIHLPFMWRWMLGRHIGLSRPNFLIIGTQRGGTTSLFRYLGHHPHIDLPIIKEIHYFDLQSQRSANWYFAHFPRTRASYLTGEASPYYLFHPDVPKRVAKLLPDIRLIVLLRDPVIRALSHYQHNRKYRLESRNLEEVINAELRAIQAGNPISIATPYAHQHHTYIARGIYIEQLNRWCDVIPREQLLCIHSTDLFRSPMETVQQVVTFLDLDAQELPQVNFYQYNQSKSDGQPMMMPQHISQMLAEFYLPYNQQLAHQFNLDIRDWIGYQE